MKYLASSLTVALSMYLYCAAAEAAVTVTKNEFRAWAALEARNTLSTTETGLTIPMVPSPLEVDAVLGDAYSKNSINWSVNGGQTVFSYDLLLKRTGVVTSAASADQYSLEFTVDVDTEYELSGFLHVTDAGENQSGMVQQWAQLYDSSSGLVPFLGQQESFGTHDEQFVLGGLGGDGTNLLYAGGSLKGMLLAEHTYELDFHYFFAAISSDAGASAVGNLTLKIGTVPEPSAVALGSIFAVLSLVRCRQIV